MHVYQQAKSENLSEIEKSIEQERSLIMKTVFVSILSTPPQKIFPFTYRNPFADPAWFP